MTKIKELYRKYKEIANYLIFGALTTLVSLAVYYALVFTVLDPRNGVQLQIANVISWVAAVTFAYFTNRKYVFESRETNMLREAARFYMARIATLLIDMGLMFLFVTVLGLNDKIFKLIVQIIVIIANYLFSKLFVFRKNSAEEPDRSEKSDTSL